MGVRAALLGWGSTPAERELTLPCDAVVPDAELTLFRAVDVGAPVDLLFRWLCQLKVAPYSYDVLVSLGRRSPQDLTPGLDDLKRGQRFMGIFRLADHEAGRQLTLEHRGVLFGHVAVTYHATPRGTDAARLLVKLAWAPLPVPVVGRLIAPVLAAGDLVMMRRQLLNLGALAERDAAARPVRFAGPS